MARQAVLAAAFLLTATAGCLAPTAEQVDPAAAPLLKELQAQVVPANATANASWYVATFRASPEGGLAALEWTIPQGARVPWGFNEVFHEDEQTVVLEVALLGARDVAAWGLMAFEADAGKLTAGGGALHVPATWAMYGGMMGEVAEAEEIPATAFASLGWEVKEGDTLRLLAMAKAPEQEIGIAFRVLDHDPHYPQSEEEPAETPERFLADRGELPPFALPVRATASGFEAHVYVDALFGGFLPTDPTYGIELVVGEPQWTWSAEREERTRGGTHTFDGSILGRLPRGYDLTYASYGSFGSYERTSYVATATLHGEPAEAAGEADALGPLALFLPTPGQGAGAAAWGIGDGVGESASTLTLERTRLPGGLVSIVALELVEIGETLEALFGLPAEHESGAQTEGGSLLPVELTSHGLVRHGAAGRALTWGMALPEGLSASPAR